ncbi:MAG: hypothetical protein P8N76_07970 [Pirellulaceae bacterium]|nr:hypothetical protein [Pirellulaceae bacterium]
MKLFDTTLRAGEQSAGVHLTPAEKASFASRLEAAGVDAIDAGFPDASRVDWEDVQAVAEATNTATLSFTLRVGKPRPIRHSQSAIQRALLKVNIPSMKSSST